MVLFVAMGELTRVRHVTGAGTPRMTATLVVTQIVSCDRGRSAGRQGNSYGGYLRMILGSFPSVFHKNIRCRSSLE